MSSDKELNKSIDMDRFCKLCYKFTDQEISDAAGIERSLVTKHRNNTRNISIADLIKYAKAFNVSVDYLLGTDTDEVTPEEFKQKVCEYTGLNEIAVDNLHTIKVETNSYKYNPNNAGIELSNPIETLKGMNLFLSVNTYATNDYFFYFYQFVKAEFKRESIGFDWSKQDTAEVGRLLQNEAVNKYLLDTNFNEINIESLDRIGKEKSKQKNEK